MSGGHPTLDDVAKVAGVSRMTVSNVYGRPDKVADATRDGVLAAARKLGYSGPSAAARTLKRGKSGVLGLVVADALPYLFADPGAARFMQGLASEAAANDLALQVIAATGPTAAQKVADAVVDGWILFGIPEEHPAVAIVRNRRRPVVTAPGPRLTGAYCVTTDARRATGDAVSHLLELGHRSFAFVTPALMEDDREHLPVPADTHRQDRATSPFWSPRLLGARDAVEAAGLDWHDVVVFECDQNARESGRNAGNSLLSERPADGLAIVAATDVLALGILDAARQLDVRIPDEVSVVGFDDIDEAAASSPPLTTIRQDLYAQGAHAAQLAAGNIRPRQRVHIHPAALVVRGTTAPPPRRTP